MDNLTLPQQRLLFAEYSKAAYMNQADGKMFGKGKGMKAHKPVSYTHLTLPTTPYV